MQNSYPLPKIIKLLGHHAIHGVEDDLLVWPRHGDVLAGPGHGVGRDGVDHDLALGPGRLVLRHVPPHYRAVRVAGQEPRPGRVHNCNR